MANPTRPVVDTVSAPTALPPAPPPVDTADAVETPEPDGELGAGAQAPATKASKGKRRPFRKRPNRRTKKRFQKKQRKLSAEGLCAREGDGRSTAS